MLATTAPEAADHPNPRASLRLALVAAATYAALVLVIWLPYNPCGGMPYESHFLFNSEVWPLWKGFWFPADPLRPHTSTFYHVSYLLGLALGVPGSFVPFQIVYAGLWWARGFLMFLIVRRLSPAQSLFCFCCGALVIVHASDHALLWVGQLNQFGFIFWTLLAFYLFVMAWQSANVSKRRALLVATIAAQHMSLWSYESQLPLMLAAPLVLLVSGPRLDRAKWRLLLAWYIVPAIYILFTAHKYITGMSGSYQAAVLRGDWSAAALAHDLWFNVASSLEFWRWAENIPQSVPAGWLAGLRLLGVAIFLAGAAAVLALREPREKWSFPPPIRWLLLLLTGVAALLLSFPAYLLLESAATLWRTQFLSGIAAALAGASLAGLAAVSLPRAWPRSVPFLALGAAVTYFGVAAALQYGAFHDQIWNRHRQAFQALLEQAPRLQDGAVVVAVNVPKANDPFGHNMWFNFALKLAYPGTHVAGIYFYDDGSPAPGNNLSLASSDWIWDQTGTPPRFGHTTVEHSIVVGYESVKSARILAKLPDLLGASEEAQQRYNPQAVVMSGPPSARAVRRYYPCPQWWWTLSPRP